VDVFCKHGNAENAEDGLFYVSLEHITPKYEIKSSHGGEY
jgi:hypothetical protein